MRTAIATLLLILVSAVAAYATLPPPNTDGVSPGGNVTLRPTSENGVSCATCHGPNFEAEAERLKRETWVGPFGNLNVALKTSPPQAPATYTKLSSNPPGPPYYFERVVAAGPPEVTEAIVLHPNGTYDKYDSVPGTPPAYNPAPSESGTWTSP